MRQRNELDWFEYRLPVIVALTVVHEPVPIDKLHEFCQINDKQRILAVLDDFAQFIYKTEAENNGRRQLCYRWYHASFFDFIARKEAVAEERVHLLDAHTKYSELKLLEIKSKYTGADNKT